MKTEQIISNDFQKNIFVELKSFSYVLNISYENIINEKTISINIKNPLNINFTIELINNDILYIIFPVSLLLEKEITSIKRKIKINLFPLLRINDKIKEFKKEKNSIIDDMMIKIKNENNNIYNNRINDEEKNNNIIFEAIDDYDNDNQNIEYVIIAKLNELIKGNNRFELFVYYCIFYEQ